MLKNKIVKKYQFKKITKVKKKTINQRNED